MALDLSTLTAAVDRSTATSEQLLAAFAAAQPDPSVELAVQHAIDEAADKLDAESNKVAGSLPPPTPAG